MASNVIKPPIALVKQAHEFVRPHIRSGDIVIDATVGNGHDTKFLLELVKPGGKVFGFDIQQQAIDSTQRLLADSAYRDCLVLLRACHAQMDAHIPIDFHGNIKAIMFNLGYLPGGDKQIITQADSTITALNRACKLLAPGGIITIIAYPGHKGGDKEAEQVKLWCKNLPQEQYQRRLITGVTSNPISPVLNLVCKRH